MLAVGRTRKNVLRIAAGTPDEVFAPPWRFWTSGTSGYFSQRSVGGFLKVSFHPPRDTHMAGVWAFALTQESGVIFDKQHGRRGRTWEVAAPSETGLYLGPAICIPRLANRPYDLPPAGADVEGLSAMNFVAAPQAGRARFLHLVVSDDRPGIVYDLAHGEELVRTLPMTNGWDLSVLTFERPLEEHECVIVAKTRDETVIQIWPRQPLQGTESSALLWVTESPADGRPLFVQIVLGSNNYELVARD